MVQPVITCTASTAQVSFSVTQTSSSSASGPSRPSFAMASVATRKPVASPGQVWP